MTKSKKPREVNPSTKTEFRDGDSAAQDFVRDLKYALSVTKPEIIAAEKAASKKSKSVG